MRKRRGFSGNAAPIGVRWLLKAMPWPCAFENILKCFHVLYYNALENVCQQIRPPVGGRQFTHMLESSGPLAAFLVGRRPINLPLLRIWATQLHLPLHGLQL